MLNNLSFTDQVYKFLNTFIYRLNIIYEKIVGLDISSTLFPSDFGFDDNYIFRSSSSDSLFLDICLRYLSVSNKDSFLDIGCGKGKVLHQASKYNFSQIDGIEIVHQISKIARINFDKIKQSRTKIFDIDAITFSKYSQYNFIYMYNPFPSEIMLRVIYKIAKSLKQNNREITLIYNNPTCHVTIHTTNIFRKIFDFAGSHDNRIFVYTNRKNHSHK